MANIRLNNEHRHYLKGVMTTTVDVPVERKLYEDAFEKAKPLMRKLVEDRWPQKDMAVLKKYKAAEWEWQMKLQLTAGGVVHFQFMTRKKDGWKDVLPTNDDAKKHGMAMAPVELEVLYLADKTATDAWNEYINARDAFDKALKDKHRDYTALIEAATTVEQVEEIWPDGGALLRKRVEATMPVVLSDEVMARIKADASLRKKTDKIEVSEDFVRRPPRRVTTNSEFVDEQFESNQQD